MKLEHCEKCYKQIEFIFKKNQKDKNQLNYLEAKFYSRANIYQKFYCDDCFIKIEILLQDKGFLHGKLGNYWDNE